MRYPSPRRLVLVPWTRRSLYALTVVALLAAKLLHLFSHLPSTPFLLFVLYFPTFLTPDLIVIFASRLIFERSRILSFLLCFIISGAAVAQIGLFVETGGELRWSMAAKVIQEPKGFCGMLMTGLMPMAVSISLLAGFAYYLTGSLYDSSFRIMNDCFKALRSRRAPQDQDGESWKSIGAEEDKTSRREGSSAAWVRVKMAAVIGTLLILHIVRPAAPFNHMTGTLPFTMLDAVLDSRSPVCNPAPGDHPKRFPFPDSLRDNFWIPSTEGKGGNSRGWSPGMPWWDVSRERPAWLPTEEAPGFAKWYRGSSFQRPPGHHHRGDGPPLPNGEGGGHGDGHVERHVYRHSGRHDDEHGDKHHRRHHTPPPPPGYESVLDPLKISNFDEPLLDELQNALREHKSTTGIKHVVVLTLESTRKDVFPLTKDGPLYEELVQSWGEHEETGDATPADLTQLSIIAEALTGEDAGFGREVNQTHGGVNVAGALTTSTYTLKSLLSSHCGVNPLPVDFLEDIESEIYQPCLPQILKIMGAQDEPDAGKKKSWRDAPWRSVFAQASTSALDRQAELMEKVGFEQFVDREALRNESSEFSVKGPELNYFGYSERELKPFIRKAIADAEQKGERLFLSHLTSSTHHPWATPEEFGEQGRYWGDSRAGDSPWNRYLNTIKFADQWVGEVLDLLKELGVDNETLVVVLGDHGFSFGDARSQMTTTYANPHVASFRIPITFYHPLLPRAQVNATVTQLSVLPTILDLLATTGSLNSVDTGIARDLIPEYEGQSLIRRFVPSRDGRQAWNIGVVNPGGTHLSLASAAHPYRYVLPVCEPTAFSFSHLAQDPEETVPVTSWEGGAKMVEKVRQAYGDEAAQWAHEAEEIGLWYMWEARRRWGYWSGSRREDRGFEHVEDGLLKHDHWWQT